MKILHLNLKRKWFEDVKNGLKPEEFRLVSDYWKKRLEGKDYDLIYVKLGYPAKDDWSRILIFKWKGYRTIEIAHQEFDGKAKVYAINLTERLKCRLI